LVRKKKNLRLGPKGGKKTRFCPVPATKKKKIAVGSILSSEKT